MKITNTSFQLLKSSAVSLLFVLAMCWIAGLLENAMHFMKNS